MTDDIKAKALALINEVLEGKALNNTPFTHLPAAVSSLVLLRAIEQREAYKQKVSDIVQDYSNHVDGGHEWEKLISLIIPKPKPKPDPLVEVAKSLGYFNTAAQGWAGDVRTALEALGLEIRKKGQ